MGVVPAVAAQQPSKALQSAGQALQPSGRQGSVQKIKPDRKLLAEALRR